LQNFVKLLKNYPEAVIISSQNEEEKTKIFFTNLKFNSTFKQNFEENEKFKQIIDE